MNTRIRSAALACAALTAGLSPLALAAPYELRASFNMPVGADEMIYSAEHKKLFVRNSGSAIYVADLNSGATYTHLAQTRFTDMDLSPDGRYVYAADYGEENIGYGTPRTTSYVSRFDMGTLSVQSKSTAHIAGRIEATGGDRFVLSSLDQWVTFSYNSWGEGASTSMLSTSTWASQPGVYAGVYRGDIEFDANSNRILHGDSGSSSQEITAFKLNGTGFIAQENSGTYGSAQGYGGSVVLATDSSAFYYGALQVDPLDVTHNRLIFPERIFAANGLYAFGDGKYYDAGTGELAGDFGFRGDTYALSNDGSELWVVDETSNTLKYYRLPTVAAMADVADVAGVAAVPEPSTYALMALGLGAIVACRRKRAA